MKLEQEHAKQAQQRAAVRAEELARERANVRLSHTAAGRGAGGGGGSRVVGGGGGGGHQGGSTVTSRATAPTPLERGSTTAATRKHKFVHYADDVEDDTRHHKSSQSHSWKDGVDEAKREMGSHDGGQHTPDDESIFSDDDDFDQREEKDHQPDMEASR